MSTTVDAPRRGRNPRPDSRRASDAATDRATTWADRLGIALPALLAYIPLLLTHPGQVGADTKTYLYLDPGRLLERAPYLWDEHIGMGTVTHQNIGYLWPMGPWYWLFENLGVPDWIAQRLWLGTVMVAAALGVRYLLRTLGWRDAARSHGVLIASLAYMLSPYVLDYSARISVILLAWAGLPWLIALTARSLRSGGWWYPAWFALTMLTVGGVNATALVLVAPGPLLFVAHAVWVEREVTGREALAALARIGSLTILTSLWWVAGLWAQGSYGLPVLRYTETYRTVAQASTAPEILRGLGYWFFYGRDAIGPWIAPSAEYTNRTLLLLLSFLLPVLALASAALVRWRHRGYFLVLLVVGALISIGAHPWDASSPLGEVFKAITGTDAGLGLRSTPRAVPLVVLSTAVFLGAGVVAVGRRLPRWSIPVTALVALLVLANLPPLWTGTMVDENLQRPEEIPEYWTEATSWLDEQGDRTRVLALPGTDFASYRWGNTVDPVAPGLMDRPFVARELFQYGSPPSAGLLLALDRALQERVLAPEAIAPVARLMGVGDILLRNDLQYERYRTARPTRVWDLFGRTPELGAPVTFGEPRPNVAGPEQPLLDEIALATDPDLQDPPPLAALPVEDPLPIARTRSTEAPLLLAGGPEGVIDAAAAGLLERDQAAFYAASVADDPETLQRVLGDGADLLLTDTNRKRGQRWGTIHQNTGYTELADEIPLVDDPSDQRLETFPDQGQADQTVSIQRGPVQVTATGYGNPVTFTPDDRPANALDGDPSTAWRVGAFSEVRGERLVLEFEEPVTTDHIGLLQPVTGIRNRAIREADLVFDGSDRVPVSLDSTSETLPGQTVTFDERTFSRLEIEVRGTDYDGARLDGVSGVGFAEVDVPGAPIQELVRPPTTLLDVVGDEFLEHRFTALFTRLRTDAREKVRSDEEPAIRRVFSIPDARSFSVRGAARLSGRAADQVIDQLIGLPAATEGGLTARSDARLPGAVRHRASAALDGDPATFWMPPFEDQAGHWIEVTLPEARTIDHLDLRVVADGRHSVPERLVLTADGDPEERRVLELGDIDDRSQERATVAVPVDFEPLTGRTYRLTVDRVRPVRTVDWHSAFDILMPVGIAELGLPGAQVRAPGTQFDSGCRDDLVTVDGDPVPVRLTGATADLLDRESLELLPCGGSVDGISLDAGEHVARTGIGRELGIDVDQLVLASEIGGAPLPVGSSDPRSRPHPDLAVTDDDATGLTVQVTGAEDPYWLVLGQSHNDGWRATVDGEDLGDPVVIDGYANGWYVDPARVGPEAVIVIEWAPQQVVWVALILSAVGVVLCLALLVLGRHHRRVDSVGGAVSAAVEPELAALPGTQPVVPRVAALGGAAAAGLFAVLNSPPPFLLVIPVALLTYATLRWRRGSRLLALGATAALALAGAWIVVEQVHSRHRPDFAWPTHFEAAHLLALLAILLLAAEGGRTLLARWREGRARGTPALCRQRRSPS